MIQLGSAFSSPPVVDEEEAEDDLLALRLELVLSALDNLAESLRDMPAPQVMIDAPDLSAIVTAVNGLKPGVDADQIAAAVVQAIAPVPAAEPDDAWKDELLQALKKLDFRLKGAGNTGVGLVSDIGDRPARQLGIVTVAGGATSGLTDVQLRATPVPVSGSVTALHPNGTATGTLTAAWDGVTPSTAPAGSVVQITVPEGHSSSGITLGGTFSAASVVAFEGSDDGVYWFALNGRRNLDVNTNDTTNVLDANPSGGPAPTGANPSHWRGNVGGISFLRVRCSTFTASDNIAVTLKTSAGVGTTFLNSPTVTRTDIGAYTVAAGTGGATVTPTSAQRIQSIAVIAPTGSAATVQIASQPLITIPAGQQIALNPNSNLKGTSYPVVVVGSASYVVELIG